jgi:hypothetical protein
MDFIASVAAADVSRPSRSKLIDAEFRSCIYVFPIMQDGKVVDSQRFMLDLEDE